MLLLVLPISPQLNIQPITSPQLARVTLDMQNLVPAPPKPDFDRDVLIPLRKAQAAALAKATDDCKAAGGTYTDQTCVMPPPFVYVAPAPAQAGDAKAFIYMHESGNDPTKYNSTGCLGLGQSCPSVRGGTPAVLTACPTMDYTCEDAWFTSYMLTHIDLDTGAPYGTWENARTFWLAHSWW